MITGRRVDVTGVYQLGYADVLRSHTVIPTSAHQHQYSWARVSIVVSGGRGAYLGKIGLLT